MDREINQEINKESSYAKVVVKGCVAAHKAATENWQNGKYTSAWIDEEGILCIKYKSGSWWHYKQEGEQWVWW